jgi:Transposase DDE domain
VQVKANQPWLLKQLIRLAEGQVPQDQYLSRQKNRGRLEHRHARLYPAMAQWQSEYAGIVCFLVVQRWGYRQGKFYKKTHYYISSYRFNCARTISQLIRHHWLIENRLHYVKDVHMNEDRNRIRHPQAAKNCSLIKNLTLNLVRLQGLQSLKKAIEFYAHNIKELYSWLL